MVDLAALGGPGGRALLAAVPVFALQRGDVCVSWTFLNGQAGRLGLLPAALRITSFYMRERHTLMLRWCIIATLFLASDGWSQTRPDIVVFDEDDPVGLGYYDASVPVITPPSQLTTVASPYGGKLPILTNQAFTGTQSGLLQWTSAPGGNWTIYIACPGFQAYDATGYSNVVLFVNGPLPIPATSLPQVGLESTTSQKTAVVNVGAFLTQGMDGDTSTWQKVVLPLTAFQPYGQFSLAQFKDVFFNQGAADNLTRTMWLDNLRVRDGFIPGAPGGVVTRAGDRNVILHWSRNSEADVVGYNIYRSANTNGPFNLLSPQPGLAPSFTDFAVTNGQPYFYLVRAFNGAWVESPNSAVVSGRPHSFASDAEFLEYVQQASFDFFWHEANPANALVRDRSQPFSPISIAGVGFELTGIGIAIDHGWISRDQGRQRVLTALRNFWNGPQGTNTTGMIGYNGWFYHMLRLDTATRDGSSELSSIDTALLLAGVLYVRQYFDTDQPDETEIRSLASAIFNRVDWQWMANGGSSLSMGWQPESGFLPWRWIGYNEAMILYIMGLGAPTNPLPPGQWSSWISGYLWHTNYGYAYVEFPPLFGHQYSHCWIDFRHIGDAYMNGHGISYFENSRRATLAQQAYCVANPGGYAGYGSNVWGLSACDGPGYGSYSGYTARGAPPAQNDDGTIAPTAVGGSMPFAAEICLPTLRHFYDQFLTNLWFGYGFRDAFNLTANWWDSDVLSIDQGAILLMAENYRSQAVWQRFAQIPEIQRGLQAAGFTNLASATPGIQRGPPAGAFTIAWPSRSSRSYQVEYLARSHPLVYVPERLSHSFGSRPKLDGRRATSD